MTGLARFDSANSLYLIDISSFIFRAFYAVRELKNKKGVPTNAVYGVASMVSRLIEEAKIENVAVLYDSPEPSFREEIDPNYKANRTAPPPELIPQFDLIEQMLSLLKMPSFRKSGIEADDLIATLTKKWLASDPSHRVVLVTGDKDLMALVEDRVCVWDTMKGTVFHEKEVTEKFGVGPAQLRDYLAIVGDSSDNIPGVTGLGPKGASELLKEFGTLEGAIAGAKAGKVKGKRGQALVEHEKDAFLSQKLATLKDDVEMDYNPKALRYEFALSTEAAQFLKDLDFHSLIERWKKRMGVTAPGPEQNALGIESSTHAREEFKTVKTWEAFHALLGAIEKTKEFCIDLETTSLNPREAKIVGVAIAVDEATGHYIPLLHQETGQLPATEVLSKLKPFIENPKFKKIGQNLKYDFSVLAENGMKPDGIGADTVVAAYVLDATGRHSFDWLCQKYLDYKPLSFEEVCGKGKTQKRFDEIPIDLATRYSAEDALYTMKLWRKIQPLLYQQGTMRVFADVELPLVPVLGAMERAGVCIDREFLAELSSTFQKELEIIEGRIQAFSKEPINLNSPKQLSHFLFEELKLPTQEKTKTGFSTDAGVLEVLAPLHEVPRLLMEYREITKLKSTYIDSLPTMIDAKTGKVHGSFHQTVTATGRLSSSDPNLQNIPIRSERGLKIRKAFIPSPGNLLLSADYSQIELRILAALSGDSDLIASFKRGEDIHRRTASEMFHIPVESVTDTQRAAAKAINFGLMYGKTAFGLSRELKIPQREAKEMIERYFKRYASVKTYLDGLIASAKEKGYSETLMGRRRPVPELQNKNPMLRGVGERIAMNTPIQGTAADIMKIAMIRMQDALDEGGFKSKMIIQVHDELVIDCDPGEMPKVKAMLVDAMENAYKMSVELKVNVQSGRNWMEL